MRGVSVSVWCGRLAIVCFVKRRPILALVSIIWRRGVTIVRMGSTSIAV